MSEHRRMRSVVAGALVALPAAAMIYTATPAGAQECVTDHAGVKVCDEVIFPDVDPPAVSPSNNSRGLPVTGADIAGLLVIGAGSIAVGTAMVRTSRRGPATS